MTPDRTISFNLIEQAWVPCIRRGGSKAELGLEIVLDQAHELQSIQAETPLETAALYRLLLAILHRSSNGPRTYGEWSALWETRHFSPDVIHAYLDQWKDRFDLFHPVRPFYQVPDARVRPKTVITLIPHWASGNNATLFDHHTDYEGADLTPAQAARTLVAAQTFGLAGLSGIPGNTFTDAPCARGMIFLVEGSNLFETLLLNLIRYPDETVLSTDEDLDRPSWEMDDPFHPDRTQPMGYLDYLTWQNRRIMYYPFRKNEAIFVREVTIAPGLRLDACFADPAKVKVSSMDPMKHYRRDPKSGYRVMRFNEDRSLWRDSAALFSISSAQEDSRPAVLRWVSNLVGNGRLDREKTLQCAALGMASDQAKIDFHRQERLPIPLVYLNGERSDELVGMLAAELERAEAIRGWLWASVRDMAQVMLSPNSFDPNGRKPDAKDIQKLMSYWSAECIYWGTLELPFMRLLSDLPYDGSALIIEWQQEVRRAAWQALEHTINQTGDHVRALKAAVKARSTLRFHFHDKFPILAKEKSV